MVHILRVLFIIVDRRYSRDRIAKTRENLSQPRRWFQNHLPKIFTYSEYHVKIAHVGQFDRGVHDRSAHENLTLCKIRDGKHGYVKTD